MSDFDSNVRDRAVAVECLNCLRTAWFSVLARNVNYQPGTCHWCGVPYGTACRPECLEADAYGFAYIDDTEFDPAKRVGL